MKNRNCNWNSIFILFALLLFLFLYVFFTVEHPLYIYNSDDWTYISYSRHIWPSIKEWNPTRILPEILMPLTAQIGVSIFMPFTGDYIASMAYAFAIVLSGFIVFYIISFGKLISNKFSLSKKSNVCLLAIIFLLSFLPFMIGTDKNDYLFYSDSVTSVFYYTIPALLNGAIVLYMLSSNNHSPLNNTDFSKIGVVLLLIYLCINSNMFQNIIISSYAAAHITYELILLFKNKRPHKRSMLSFMYDNFYQFFIIFLWSISLYFESQGGRASQINSNHNFNLQRAFQSFLTSLNRLDHFYLFQLCFIVGIAFLIAFGKYKKIQSYQQRPQLEKTLFRLSSISLLACTGTILYLVLLEAVTGGGYISKTNCMISWMFWLFIIEATSLAYLVKKIPVSKTVLPLFVLCLIFETFMHESRYNDIAYGAPETLKRINDYMLQQIATAEESGQNYVEVHIPVHNSSGWPLNTSWGGDRIAVTLYRHGITDEIMKIVLVPDESVNEQFHLKDELV